MEKIKSFFSFFYEITFELIIYGDDWVDRVMGAIFTILLSVIVILLAWIGFVLINQFGLQTVGTKIKPVVSRDFTPAHMQPVTISTGKVTSVILIPVPDTFALCFDFEKNKACADVSKEFWEQSNPGTELIVDYAYGRLNGNYVVTGIE